MPTNIYYNFLINVYLSEKKKKIQEKCQREKKKREDKFYNSRHVQPTPTQIFRHRSLRKRRNETESWDTHFRRGLARSPP